ncbi:RNA polymerase II transcription factor B subunit 1 [Dinochytrium kinnereticum]|nr:RNA polymerase II transcription factor B subunit 1 [Dinochytrium kinnereticum]
MKVLFRKIEGNLQLSSHEFGYAPDPCLSILAQSVNVSTAKVLLKITQWGQGTQPETNYNFQFTGKDAVKDRERVKETLSVEISKNRVANAANDVTGGSAITSQDIQIRQSLLSKDKELARLHKELVMSGIIGEEEFWLNRKAFNISQKKGTSSASLADVKPSVSEGSDLKYTLTPEIIHSIFIQYPSVQKAYNENVPAKLSETDFWTKFIASKYFHKTRLPGQNLEVDDIFKNYLVEDEDDALPIPKRPKKSTDNALLDLSTTAEDHFAVRIDYGNMPDSTMKPGGVRSSLPLIRRFNRHSEVVLKSSKIAKTDYKTYDSDIALDDLSTETPPDEKVIEIKDPFKYFESHSFSEEDSSKLTNERPDQLLFKFSNLIHSWNHRLSEVRHDEIRSESSAKLPGVAARNNGKFMRDSHEIMPEGIQSLHRTACELLRYFWSLTSSGKSGGTDSRLLKLIEGIRRCRSSIDEVCRTQFQDGVEKRKAMANISNALEVASNVRK